MRRDPQRSTRPPSPALSLALLIGICAPTSALASPQGGAMDEEDLACGLGLGLGALNLGIGGWQLVDVSSGERPQVATRVVGWTVGGFSALMGAVMQADSQGSSEREARVAWWGLSLVVTSLFNLAMTTLATAYPEASSEVAGVEIAPLIAPIGEAEVALGVGLRLIDF